MGVDVTLLVIDCPLLTAKPPEAGAWLDYASSHTMLMLVRQDNSMCEEFRDACEGEIPANVEFSSYLSLNEDEERCYGVTQKDSYDDPLLWGYAPSFVKVLEKYDYPTNVAAREYLRALPATVRVVPFFD